MSLDPQSRINFNWKLRVYLSVSAYEILVFKVKYNRFRLNDFKPSKFKECSVSSNMGKNKIAKSP
jgi:hypothetical protein